MSAAALHVERRLQFWGPPASLQLRLHDQPPRRTSTVHDSLAKPGVVTGYGSEQEFAEKVGRRHGAATRASLLRHFAARDRHTRARALPVLVRRPLAGALGHERRETCNARSRGSRRTTAPTRAGPGSDDPDSDEGDPDALKLWGSRWGRVSPNLLRVLLREGAR